MENQLSLIELKRRKRNERKGDCSAPSFEVTGFCMTDITTVSSKPTALTDVTGPIELPDL